MSHQSKAINSVLARKLFLFARIYLGPANIIDYFVLYFKICLVTSILVREWQLCCTNFIEIIPEKIQHIHKKMITALATSHRLAESARAAALQRLRLYHLHRFNTPRRSLLHLSLRYHPPYWISSPLVPPSETGKEFICCVRACCRLISFSPLLFLCKF